DVMCITHGSPRGIALLAYCVPSLLEAPRQCWLGTGEGHPDDDPPQRWVMYPRSARPSHGCWRVRHGAFRRALRRMPSRWTAAGVLVDVGGPFLLRHFVDRHVRARQRDPAEVIKRPHLLRI